MLGKIMQQVLIELVVIMVLIQVDSKKKTLQNNRKQILTDLVFFH